MDKNLNGLLRKLAITKQLNFLIGSGESMPTIPSMQDESLRSTENISKNWDELTDDDKKEIAINLSNKVKQVSTKILSNDSEVLSTQKVYNRFLQSIIEVLNLSNSRSSPKNANIFTTNYDLFIEKAADTALKNNRIVFNDGAGGYFDRYLSSANYNRVVAYKGINDNYIAEIPSLSLIKPHGSMNWESISGQIRIVSEVQDNPVIVSPTGYESESAFLQNHFYDMLRIFETELDKPQSVLFIIGFSFQDKHIGTMIKRAMQNPELMIFAFGFKQSNYQEFLNNLNMTEERSNFKIIVPDKGNTFTLKDLTDILMETSNEADLDDLD